MSDFGSRDQIAGMLAADGVDADRPRSVHMQLVAEALEAGRGQRPVTRTEVWVEDNSRAGGHWELVEA